MVFFSTNWSAILFFFLFFNCFVGDNESVYLHYLGDLSLFVFGAVLAIECSFSKSKVYLHYFGDCQLQLHYIVKSSFFEKFIVFVYCLIIFLISYSSFCCSDKSRFFILLAIGYWQWLSTIDYWLVVVVVVVVTVWVVCGWFVVFCYIVFEFVHLFQNYIANWLRFWIWSTIVVVVCGWFVNFNFSYFNNKKWMLNKHW